MSFIGVFLDNKKFQILQKNMNKIDKTLINIKKKSIENVKNVKFDIIVISENLENFKEEIWSGFLIKLIVVQESRSFNQERYGVTVNNLI